MDKPFYMSKGFWGTAIGLVALGLKSAGVEITPEDQAQAGDLIYNLVIAAAGILALVGRWTAKGPLSGPKGGGKAVIIITVMLLMGGAAGCGVSKVQSVALNKDGTPMLDGNGAPIILTHELDGEGAYYDASKATAEAASKPVFEMRIPEGETATLPGGTEILVRAGGAGGAKVQQYRHPGWDMANSITMGLLGAWDNYNMRKLGEAGIAGAQGVVQTFTAEGQSGIMQGSGDRGQASQTIPQANPVTTTTTITDDHSGGEVAAEPAE